MTGTVFQHVNLVIALAFSGTFVLLCMRQCVTVPPNSSTVMVMGRANPFHINT